MDYPVYPDHDEDILTDEPGLMPDILEPLEESSGMLRLSDRPASVLLSLDTPLDAAPGDYEIRAERVYFEPGTPGDLAYGDVGADPAHPQRCTSGAERAFYAVVPCGQHRGGVPCPGLFRGALGADREIYGRWRAISASTRS